MRFFSGKNRVIMIRVFAILLVLVMVICLLSALK